MPRKSLLMLFLTASTFACNGKGGKQNDPDDPNADGVMTVHFDVASGLAHPLYAAIDSGDGWTVLDPTAASSDAEIAEDATEYRLVVVCESLFGGRDVTWLFATVDGVPEPSPRCPTLDASTAVTTTGTGSGTYDLVQASLGWDSRTFFPYMGEELALTTPPGTYDLVAIPMPSDGSVPTGLIARPALTAGGPLDPMDFSTDLIVPNGYSFSVTGGTPYYVEVNGFTENGTNFFAGHESFVVPPDASGVITETLWAHIAFDDSDQYFWTDEVGDFEVVGTASEPFHYGASVESGLIVVDSEVEADGLVISGHAYTEDFTEQEVRVVFAERMISYTASVPLDPSDELEGFPEDAIVEEGDFEGFDAMSVESGPSSPTATGLVMSFLMDPNRPHWDETNPSGEITAVRGERDPD